MPAEPIYLDYNATTPILPSVADAMLPYLQERFGNPSSAHAFGRAAREAVDGARESVARLLDCDPNEIVFTSGGTESNNMAIAGVARLRAERGRHFVTSAVEHPAVLEPLKALERDGAEVSVVGVDGYCRVDPRDVEAVVRDDTVLVSIMHANNETGTVQRIPELAAAAHERGALFHSDAAQSVGKIRTRVQELDVDLLTLAGHKLYAPKGVGALWIRSGLELPSFLHGANHEAGRRAGTENVPQIVGLGRAADIAWETLVRSGQHAEELRDRLWTGLARRLPDIRRFGHVKHCLPNTLSVGFRHVDASVLLDALGDRVAASAGAACHAEGVTISTVLEAMDVPLEFARGTVRFSLGRLTTEGEIERAIPWISEAVETIRAAP